LLGKLKNLTDEDIEKIKMKEMNKIAYSELILLMDTNESISKVDCFLT
jgi:hypothetical protein